MSVTFGYDYEPKSNSAYVKLVAKGSQAKIRLITEPVKFQEEFEGKVSDKFAWLVIDRADGNIKGFKGGVSIYKLIRSLALNEDWGDPKNYDLTITRTEEQGNYYTIQPSPNKSPLTDEEQGKIIASDLSVEKLFKISENLPVEDTNLDDLPIELR